MTSTDFDVVVVGFGPAGAVAACLLGQAGLRTLAIDRVVAVWDKPRAIAIDHEIMRLFQNLGMADKVLPHVAPFTASEHFGADGQLIRRIDMVPPPYPQGYTPSMVFTQPPVEAALRAHAASYPSVEVQLGVEFISLEQATDHVAVTLQAPQADPSIVTAAYVIGCDGASSTVRQHLGIAFEDLVFDEPWMVIDVRVNDAGLAKLPATAAQFCEPARPSTFIVGPGNHRRWEIMLLPGEDPRTMERPKQVWQLLSRWLSPGDGELWRASSYRFHALVASQWRAGRVFLAGDAAHQQPPFIGQGMCQGIRDVGNLSWKLAAVIRGTAFSALLDTYGEERDQHVRTLTARIKAIGHTICERDPVAARRRDADLLAQGGGTARTVTRQEIVPPIAAGLLADTAHPANGTLFPQPWVAGADGPRHLDDVVGTGWRMVLDGRAAGAWPNTAMPIVTIQQPGHSGLVEQDGILAAWFDKYGCVGAIVRPDHYVYGVLPDFMSAPAVLDDLKSRLGGRA
ncbi:MAG: FAD-binding monooxygenase [Rhodopila sp.]|nr:FAD-binding monooxygenase [Rhodopila sp.]